MARIDIKSSNTGGGGGGNLQLAGGASMTTTLTAVTDTSNVASPLKLSTAAVQVTSPLRITTSDASGFYLDAEDSATNNRFSIKRDPSAQEVTLDFASNPSGSTTLVGAIRTYRDGVNLSAAMSFIEDGSVGVGTSAPVGILHLYKSAAATRLAIDGDAGQNRLISYRTGAVQRFGLYVNNTAESGSNAGSNFAIRAYNDAGTLLSTPFFITRSSGNVGIGTTAPTSKFVVSDNTAGDPTVLIEKDVISSFSDIYAYNKNASTNLTTGQLAGQVSFGGYFNSNYSPINQEFSAVQGYYTGTGTTRRGGLRLSTHDGSNLQPAVIVDESQLVGIGQTTPTALLHVLGKGSTSATTSLLVQNSSGVDMIKITDDITTTIGNQFNIIRTAVPSQLIEINANFNTIGAGIRAGGNSKDFIISAKDSRDLYLSTNFSSSITEVQFAVKHNIGVLIKDDASTTMNASARLEVASTTQGFLPPRMTTTQKNAIATPAAGLMVYDTTLNKLCVYTTAWETITSI